MNHYIFRIGERVQTIKGDRMKRGSARFFAGTVVGYAMWKDYKAVRVQKDNGKVVTCLERNLVPRHVNL